VSGVTKKHDQRSAWQDAADCGEQGAVGGFQPGSWELASEDGELLAQD
jgi:hypothetical protein